jgi:hypothetical protein
VVNSLADNLLPAFVGVNGAVEGLPLNGHQKKDVDIPTFVDIIDNQP